MSRLSYRPHIVHMLQLYIHYVNNWDHPQPVHCIMYARCMQVAAVTLEQARTLLVLLLEWQLGILSHTHVKLGTHCQGAVTGHVCQMETGQAPYHHALVSMHLSCMCEPQLPNHMHLSSTKNER